MHPTSTSLRVLLLACTIVTSLTLFSCESDPILAPQSEVAEEGGSYGNTNLPVSGAGNTENTVKDQQNGEVDSNNVTTINPKLF